MSKIRYCGECEHFDPDFNFYGLFDGYCDLYENTDGFGVCGKTNEVCRCSDKCHLINGKP